MGCLKGGINTFIDNGNINRYLSYNSAIISVWGLLTSYLDTASHHTLINSSNQQKVETGAPRITEGEGRERLLSECFIGYPKETMSYNFYFPPENKIVVARYVEFLEKNLLSQEINRRAEELKEIQDEDTSPSKNNSEIPMKVEEVEEHSLGDLNEPINYKATILDSESDKWVDAMNAEMQSMKDN
ncbi:hypothetical protein Tco_1283946 [Tanacetum coccineum]